MAWGLVANLILQHLYGCQSNNNNNNNNNNCVLTTRVDYYNTTCFRVTDSVFHSGDTNPAHVIQCCPDTRIEGERQIGKPANMGPFSPLKKFSSCVQGGVNQPAQDPNIQATDNHVPHSPSHSRMGYPSYLMMIIQNAYSEFGCKMQN